METGECLVICDAQGGEGLVEVNAEPVDADVEVAPEDQRDHRSREDPEVQEH